MSTWCWLFSAAALAVLLLWGQPLRAQEAGEDHKHPKDEVDLFLEEFRALPRQDPFRPLVRRKAPPKPTAVVEPFDEPAAPAKPKQVVFDGQTPAEGSGYERMPRIKITGVMQVRNKMAACGVVDEERVVLHPGDTIVLNNEGASADRAKHFTVVDIDSGGMTIVLDDGHQIRGKFH